VISHPRLSTACTGSSRSRPHAPGLRRGRSRWVRRAGRRWVERHRQAVSPHGRALLRDRACDAHQVHAAMMIHAHGSGDGGCPRSIRQGQARPPAPDQATAAPASPRTPQDQDRRTPAGHGRSYALSLRATSSRAAAVESSGDGRSSGFAARHPPHGCVTQEIRRASRRVVARRRRASQKTKTSRRPGRLHPKLRVQRLRAFKKAASRSWWAPKQSVSRQTVRPSNQDLLSCDPPSLYHSPSVCQGEQRATATEQDPTERRRSPLAAPVAGKSIPPRPRLPLTRGGAASPGRPLPVGW